MGALSEQVHRRHAVRVAEDVGALRRAAAAMAATLDGVRPGHAELAATELATNLTRHATSGGYVLLRSAGNAIELIAVDGGPGMPPASLPLGRSGAAAPPARPALDAASPGSRSPGAGSLGAGLAGVERLACDFDWYSSPLGTVILTRVGAPAATPAGRFRWGGVNVPLSGAGESGDGWAVAAGQRLGVAMVDGLGHGPAAATAAAAAISAFHAAPPGDPAAYLRRAHEAMLGTRGGVLAACEIDPVGQALVGLQAGQRAGGFDTKRLREDGTGVDVAVTVSAMRDAGGALVGLSTVLRDVTDRLRAEAELAAARAAREVLADRDRMARDLHDRVIQRIFGAALTLQGTVSLAAPPDMAARIEAVLGELDSSIEEIPASIFTLPRAPGDPVSVRAGLLGLVSNAAGGLGFIPTVSFSAPVDTVVPGGIATQVLAVAREALSNMTRHAHASAGEVGLTPRSEPVLLVSDNRGALGETTRRTRLRNLRGRAAGARGTPVW